MMIRDIITFFRYQRVVREVVKNTDFVKALSISFGVNFKVDWIYRIYTVINPQIQQMGESGNNIIYDDQGNPIVDRWVLNNFIIIDNVLKNNQVFDIFTYDIKKLDEDFNYSLIIQNVMFKDFIKAIKRLGIVIPSITLIIILLIVFI